MVRPGTFLKAQTNSFIGRTGFLIELPSFRTRVWARPGGFVGLCPLVYTVYKERKGLS